MSARGSSRFDDAGRIVRIEEAGRRFAAALGLALAPGLVLADADAARLAEAMADRLFEAIDGGAPCARRGRRCCGCRRSGTHGRGRPISAFPAASPNISTGAETQRFGDLGPLLARRSAPGSRRAA